MNFKNYLFDFEAFFSFPFFQLFGHDLLAYHVFEISTFSYWFYSTGSEIISFHMPVKLSDVNGARVIANSYQSFDS